ncbi:MAG: PspA/IM30 family protein [Ktedonobacteraceae bacterium]|nr:PspA/IM30 family protein [Ktedonobacteraceae bacterium]MBA3826143.1 PspA/IM30 family protein [Ktedonobacterales bacterium]
MGLFSRFSTFLKAKFSSAMDRAEDPNDTLDYSYQKQLEQLQNLRRSIADVVTSEKSLEMQQAQVNQQMSKLDDQARAAVQQGRDDLARLALERKTALQGQIDSFAQQIAQMKTQQQKFVDMERRLSARVAAFRTQKEMVKAQYSAAQAQVKIQESVTGISEEMSDVNLAVTRAQDKVLKMQARAQAMDQLVDSGTLPELGAPGQDDIDRQLAQVTNQTAVDAQLAQLKASVQGQLPPPREGQTREPGQLPPPATTTDGGN